MGLKRDILITLAFLAIAVTLVAGLVGIVLLAAKAIGLLLFLGGIFLVVFFPGIPDYQPGEMADLAVKIGFVLILIGLVLLFVL